MKFIKNFQVGDKLLSQIFDLILGKFSSFSLFFEQFTVIFLTISRHFFTFRQLESRVGSFVESVSDTAE